MAQQIHVGARVDQELKERLEEIARRKRQETGEVIRVADVIRIALSEYADRELPAKE